MTSPERLSIALTDRYRIERELGAGGMATVCRVITRTITEPARPVNEFRKNVGPCRPLPHGLARDPRVRVGRVMRIRRHDDRVLHQVARLNGVVEIPAASTKRRAKRRR